MDKYKVLIGVLGLMWILEIPYLMVTMHMDIFITLIYSMPSLVCILLAIVIYEDESKKK
jgi:hypothetical protein